jgi:hypothetical protein
MVYFWLKLIDPDKHAGDIAKNYKTKRHKNYKELYNINLTTQ